MIDPKKPNVICVDKKHKKLANDIKFNLDLSQKLTSHLSELMDMMNYLDAHRKLLWNNVKNNYKEELNIIAPEGNYHWDVIDDKVYVAKADKNINPFKKFMEMFRRRR